MMKNGMMDSDTGKHDVKPFSMAELDRFYGLEFANGVAPRKNMKHWFGESGRAGGTGDAMAELTRSPVVAAFFTTGKGRYCGPRPRHPVASADADTCGACDVTCRYACCA